MKISFLPMLLAAAVTLPASVQSPTGMAWITSVEPDSGRVGDVLTIHGTNLGKDNVAELYLTDGKVDIKVVIVEQTPDLIRFRIPAETNPGRFSLMVLTGKGSDQKLLEQPVRVTVLPERKGPTATAS